jgi:hypothetical protein
MRHTLNKKSRAILHAGLDAKLNQKLSQKLNQKLNFFGLFKLALLGQAFALLAFSGLLQADDWSYERLGFSESSFDPFYFSERDEDWQDYGDRDGYAEAVVVVQNEDGELHVVDRVGNALDFSIEFDRSLEARSSGEDDYFRDADLGKGTEPSIESGREVNPERQAENRSERQSEAASKENHDFSNRYAHVSYNSGLLFEDTFPDRIRWVMIRIYRADHPSRASVYYIENHVGDQAIRLPLFMRYGPGEYLIDIWQTEAHSPYVTYNERKKQFFILNADEREDRLYLLPSFRIESSDPEIHALATKIVRNKSTVMEQSRAIHDWVAQNIRYDVEALRSGVVKNYSALETLQLRNVVCNGYARLNAALHRAVGIPARLVTGTAAQPVLSQSQGQRREAMVIRNGQLVPAHSAFDEQSRRGLEDHMWNEVWVDGRWMIQDPTWNAGGVNARTGEFNFRLSHKYFDPDPTAFKETHTKMAVADE